MPLSFPLPVYHLFEIKNELNETENNARLVSRLIEAGVMCDSLLFRLAWFDLLGAKAIKCQRRGQNGGEAGVMLR